MRGPHNEIFIGPYKRAYRAVTWDDLALAWGLFVLRTVPYTARKKNRRAHSPRRGRRMDAQPRNYYILYCVWPHPRPREFALRFDILSPNCFGFFAQFRVNFPLSPAGMSTHTRIYKKTSFVVNNQIAKRLHSKIPPFLLNEISIRYLPTSGPLLSRGLSVPTGRPLQLNYEDASSDAAAVGSVQ